jgi:hypothetical protein
LTKLISDNIINWDEHLSTMLFSYIIAYKVATWYTPYQLLYGLHPLMPTKYIVLIASGNEKDSTLVTILISKVSEIGEIARSKDASCKNYWHSAME